MSRVHLGILGLLILAGCGRNAGVAPVVVGQPAESISLAEARQGFKTNLVAQAAEKEPVPEPPPAVFRTVYYDSAAGKLAAYLTPDPMDGKKHPAIVWITGGDCNTIGELWGDEPPSNDQTAAAFRKAGIVMMFPSLRGGNDNPGAREGFYGEVDDVLAAREFLSKQAYVDADRIYLGGHSTGGTLVLLVAECSDQFRAVFSFGPVEDIRGYGPEFMPFDASSQREIELRAPIRWLHSIKSPVFVLEGRRQPGNLDSLQAMQQATTNPLIHFLAVDGANHFSILAPVNQLLASKVLLDNGSTTNLALTEQELAKLFMK